MDEADSDSDSNWDTTSIDPGSVVSVVDVDVAGASASGRFDVGAEGTGCSASASGSAPVALGFAGVLASADCVFDAAGSDDDALLQRAEAEAAASRSGLLLQGSNQKARSSWSIPRGPQAASDGGRPASVPMRSSFAGADQTCICPMPSAGHHDYVLLISAYQQFLLKRREWASGSAFGRSIEFSAVPLLQLPLEMRVTVDDDRCHPQSTSVLLTWAPSRGLVASPAECAVTSLKFGAAYILLRNALAPPLLEVLLEASREALNTRPFTRPTLRASRAECWFGHQP